MGQKNAFEDVIEEGVGFKWMITAASMMGVFAIIITIAVWYNGGCSVSSSKSSAIVTKPEIMANITTKLNDITITNNNDYIWTLTTNAEGSGIAIEINGKYRYIYENPINQKEKVNLKLSEFTDPSGLRFNFFERKVLTVSINCNEGYTIYKNGSF
ncbi:MAG: hypothetical protein ACM3SY_16785 [Candidatus Omnitrophota bacterium]